LSAATTCAAVLVIAPPPSVARLTRIALPTRLVLSGASGAPGSTSCAFRVLPPR
jgi:hypothetical protein